MEFSIPYNDVNQLRHNDEVWHHQFIIFVKVVNDAGPNKGLLKIGPKSCRAKKYVGMYMKGWPMYANLAIRVTALCVLLVAGCITRWLSSP